MTENGSPDRWDIVEGHYLFCVLHHEGQWSDRYARLCRISRYFKPGPLWSENDLLDPEDPYQEGAREVYLSLCRKHGEEPAQHEERET